MPRAEIPSFEPLAAGFSVGEATAAYVTRMRQPVEAGTEPSLELLAGDVQQRTCKRGGAACFAAGCQAPEGYVNTDKQCSDLNLKDIADRMGINSGDMLMVRVTGNAVGFYDDLDKYENLRHIAGGIRELPGFNAFFAKESDGVVLANRQANCGFAAIEFPDKGVFGILHLTLPNLQGESQLRFEFDGRPVGSFEYYIRVAAQRYGCDISKANVRLMAAIKGENYHYTFTDKSPEDVFPGWFGQGMLINTSNPYWQLGDPIDPQDIWEPQFREMVRWQIMRSGISPSQYTEEGIIDTSDLELGHASNHSAALGKVPDGRDACLVMARSYFG